MFMGICSEFLIDLILQVSIRVCDVNQGKLGETAIALVLPTLLHKGVANSAEEVRSIR